MQIGVIPYDTMPAQMLNAAASTAALILHARSLAGSHHGSVLLLEPIAEPLLGLEPLVNAAHDATLLSRAERLAGEVGYAVFKAFLDHAGIHLANRWLIRRGAPGEIGRHERERRLGPKYIHEAAHLLLLHARRQLALFFSVEAKWQRSARVEIG